MPYNPGVQDLSGQILAQGMMARTQGITSAIKDFAKNEDDRQKTVAAVKGMMMDPYFQQQLSTDPQLLATAEKVKSGNARLSDVQAFLGTLTTMQHGRQEELQRQELEVKKQYNDALREQAIAQAASIDAATKERERQNLISNEFLKSVKEADDLEKMQSAGRELTNEQQARLDSLADNPFLATARQGMRAGLDPMTAIKLGQSQEAIDAKMAATDAMAQARDQANEVRRLTAEMQSMKNRRFNAGDEREFTIDGKKLNAVWSGTEFIDAQTGAPIYTTVETRDMLGNTQSQRGRLNPEIARIYGIKTTDTAQPGMPSDLGAADIGADRYVPVDQAARNYPMPNKNAIDALRKNPTKSAEFDAKFGPGAAARFLGK